MSNHPCLPFNGSSNGPWPVDSSTGEGDWNSSMSPPASENGPNNVMASRNPGFPVPPNRRAGSQSSTELNYLPMDYAVQTPLAEYYSAGSVDARVAATNGYVVDPTNHGFAVAYPPARFAAIQDSGTPPNAGINPAQPINGLRCEWRDCTSTRTFTREADLWRHIRNLHVARVNSRRASRIENATGEKSIRLFNNGTVQIETVSNTSRFAFAGRNSTIYKYIHISCAPAEILLQGSKEIFISGPGAPSFPPSADPTTNKTSLGIVLYTESPNVSVGMNYKTERPAIDIMSMADINSQEPARAL
ncbi:hypothetical protein BO78DRAFT_415699 [Aspergillus sclerotiicarbonarius CBS 121057]|uniref:Uncharacterized protein n=1 Tax=Aspergillus sclerotiicarbonarius (strain CBS 121057 / IBT 28362) TaxID=1448318 RepID=A0A319EGF2_ASPSB|nr:hypothetical protein BO78DRAFT_415699 [Aspergillus sclerotiicarbonarius CBS 121057]